MSKSLESALGKAEALQDYNPSLSTKIASIAVDLRGNDDHFILPSVFIRPFREEIDSLQRKIEIQNADKESGVKSPNQWKAFQPV